MIIILGISIFSGMENSLEENLRYLREASKLGIRKVFTSLHIPEASKECEIETLKILEEINNLDMQIIADISKKYYDEIDLNKYNIYSLRLDFGFSNKEIAELTINKSYNITLNASTLTKKDIDEIITYGGDISRITACHNYYPKEHTAISEELFKERTELFKEYNIKIMAFIPSQYKKRGPIYEGLPTLEKHRYIDPLISAQHLFLLGADTVIVGDTEASVDELYKLNMIEYNIVTIPIQLMNNISREEIYLLKQNHTNRTDPGECNIRSQESRIYKQETIKRKNTIHRQKYYVTIDNEDYLRYEGDLIISKQDLPQDKRVNVVADARESKLLIDNIKPGQRFKFLIMEN
ncbi:MupG family TIM beta-alpha barrel fold protein [Senegalia massiliensis]|uniref:MupG family TIM beta-alpha barrel fold protein n=1 Tax=Senegalia massiliensis TaxID=1720316 RepID=UPI0024158D00|nr:MupG family TIM beta-alpha barrel fold protein [Senegalia massiliensis]